MSPKRLASGILVQVVLQAPCSHAYSSFIPKIPNGDNVKGCDGEAWRRVGHVTPDGNPRNPFGIDFKDAGTAWTTELCNKDSDGDGQSNGIELGDPNCKWKEGETPERTDGITHPGIDCTVPTPAPVPPPLGLDSSAIFLLHGIFMLLAWALTLPMGAAVPVVWKRVLGDPKWFKVHQALQLLGGLFALVGFGLAFYGCSTHFWGPGVAGIHKLGGLFIVLLMLGQMVAANFRPGKDAPSRSNWLLSHRVIACALLVYSVFQCVGGIMLYGEWPTFLWSLLVAFLGATVVFIAVGATSAGKKEDQIELKS